MGSFRTAALKVACVSPSEIRDGGIDTAGSFDAGYRLGLVKGARLKTRKPLSDFQLPRAPRLFIRLPATKS